MEPITIPVVSLGDIATVEVVLSVVVVAEVVGGIYESASHSGERIQLINYIY